MIVKHVFSDDEALVTDNQSKKGDQRSYYVSSTWLKHGDEQLLTN